MSLPPSVPTGLVAVEGNRRVSLAWADLSAVGKGLDFAYYRLERSTDLVTFVTVTTTTATTYTDMPLPALVTDYYRLIARDLRGNESAATRSPRRCRTPSCRWSLSASRWSPPPLTVTLSWSPVTRFGDGTSFANPAAPDVRLIGYSVFRSTDARALEFVHVTSLPVITTTLLNGTGGLGYFYHIKSYNTQGISTNTLTVSSLGDRLFSVDNSGTELVLDAANSLMLNAATNGFGADVRIMSTRRPQDVGGSVFQSAKWTAFLNGVTEMVGFACPSPRASSCITTPRRRRRPDHRARAGPLRRLRGAGPGCLGLREGRRHVLEQRQRLQEDVRHRRHQRPDRDGGVPQPGPLPDPRAVPRRRRGVRPLERLRPRGHAQRRRPQRQHHLHLRSGPRNAVVRGKIYDMTGSFVADMEAGLVPNTITWNGKMNGRAATSGVYVYKIEGDGRPIPVPWWSRVDV